jgi:hypothetical protein
MNKEINPVSLLWRIRKQPANIVTMVLSSIPESVLLDCNTVVADLAMGDGSYLAEVARRRVANGASIERAQSTLYGYEKSPVYLEAARKLNGLQHAKLAILRPETELNSLSMKFDVIVGNPPYQDSSTDCYSKKLWHEFILKSFDLLKDKGYLSLITPNSLVGKTRVPASFRKMFTTNFSLDSIDHTADSYFKVGVGICSWAARKVPYEGKTIVTDGSGSRVIDLRKELPVPQDKKNVVELSEKIHEGVKAKVVPVLNTENPQVVLSEDENGSYKVYTSGRNKFFLSGETSKNFGKWKVVFSGSATYKQWFVTQSDVTGTNFVVYVDNPKEGVEIGETLFNPIVMFYLDNWRKTAGYTPAIKNKNCVPDIRGLNNVQLCELFKLTKEEYGYIVDNYKPYGKELPRVI